MKKIFTILSIVAITTVSAQTVLTQWNFDGGITTATTGNGTATIIGATGTPSFPAGNPNQSWSTTGFPAQGTGSGTAGFRFATSTVGVSTISVSVDIAGSNTASKYYQLQYTADGTTWNNVDAPKVIGQTSAPSTWVTIAATLPANAANNANFAFRVVSVFDPANNSTYTAIGATSNYAVTGTTRVDNATIYNGVLSTSDVNSAKVNLVKNTTVTNTLLFGANANVQIVNSNGQVVKSAAVTENSTLDVASLVKGMYIVTGEVNGQKVSQKIIKN